jgi:hypothetical protein
VIVEPFYGPSIVICKILQVVLIQEVTKLTLRKPRQHNRWNVCLQSQVFAEVFYHLALFVRFIKGKGYEGKVYKILRSTVVFRALMRFCERQLICI